MASQSDSGLTPRNSLSLFRVSKLQELEKTNSELLEKNLYYEKLCLQLRKDIDTLKVKNSVPKSQVLLTQGQSQCELVTPSHSGLESVSQPNTETYETDEEELNIEIGNFETSEKTQWKTVTNKKRTRDSPGKENNNQKQHQASPYWLSKDNSSTNRFAPLQIEAEHQNNPNSERISKPPPIFVDNVSNIQPLILFLNEIAKDQFDLRNLRNQQVKIMPKTPEFYKIIICELEKKNTEFFTYKLKEERSFKVILRNMHPSVNIEDLKNELLELGHEVTNIWNIRKRETKEPLPLFEVDLKLNPNNREIYNIKSLMYSRISFEPPRPKKTIPQCTNCQQYGHTKSFCKRKPKCIKCAGTHLSKNCERKNWESQVKCALCNGNHPANYKGCSIYKQIHQSQYPPLRKSNDISSAQNNINAVNKNAPAQPNTSVNSHSHYPIPKNSQNHFSYASVLSGANSQNEHTTHQNVPINLNSQINHENLNSNVTLEIINALKGLMGQMQQMTSLLMNIMSQIGKN